MADEIAYTTADLDDGYEAHLLELRAIRAGVPVFEGFYCEAEKLWPNVLEKLRFNEALRHMLNRFVGDLIRTTQQRIRAARVRSVDDVRKCPERLVSFSAEVDEQRRQAKAFLYSTLYYSPALDSEKVEGERVIRKLFEFWIAKPESLPSSYREKAGQEPLPRVVCDYIAGMTDNYIYEQYEKYCRR